MAQIKKYKYGLQVQYVDATEAQINELLNSPEIDSDLKALALAVRESALNVIDAEGFTGRDERRYRAGINLAMLNILLGLDAYNQAMTGSAYKNIFGYYSLPETDWMVNETVRRTLNPNTMGFNYSNMPSIATSDTSTDDNWKAKDHYYWKWNNGFDLNAFRPDLSTSEKINLLSSKLATNLTALLQAANNDNYIIHGLNQDLIQQLPAIITNLLNISSLDSDTEKFAALSNAVSDLSSYSPNLVKNFRAMFPEIFTPTQQEATPAVHAASVTPAGSVVTGDLNYSYNLDFLDPTADNYLKLVLINAADNTQKVYDLSKLEDINALNLLGLWDEIAKLIYKANEAKYGPYIEDYRGLGNGQRIIDFSNFFTDEDAANRDIITANIGDFDFTKNLWLPYSDWINNWDNIKSRFKYAGNADADINSSDMSHLYSKNLGYTPLDLANIPDVDIKNAVLDATIEGTKLKYKDILSEDPNALALFIGLYIMAEKLSQDGVSEQLNPYVQILYNTFGQDRLNQKIGKDDLVDYIANQLWKNKSIFNYLVKKAILSEVIEPEYRLYAIQKMKGGVSSKKEGGIISAFLGTAFLLPLTTVLQSDDSENEEKSTNYVIDINGKKNYNDTPEFTDKLKRGLWYGLLGALGDLVLMFNPEPISSGIGSAGILGLNYASNKLLGVPTWQKWTDVGIDAVAGAASVIPLFGNITLYPKLAFKLSKIGKYLSYAGIGGGAVAEYFGIKNAADKDLFNRLFTDPKSLSTEDAQQLVRLLTNSMNLSRSLEGAIRSTRNPISEGDIPEFLQAKNKQTGKIEYEKIDLEKAATAALIKDKALELLHFWNIGKKNQARKAYTEAITPETHTPIYSRSGNPKTEVNYAVDPEKLIAKEEIKFNWPTGRKLYVTDYPKYNPNDLGTLTGVISKWGRNLDIDFVPSFLKTYKFKSKQVAPNGLNNKSVTVYELDPKDWDAAMKRFDKSGVEIGLDKSKVSNDLKNIIGETPYTAVMNLDGQTVLFYSKQGAPGLQTRRGLIINSKFNGGRLNRLTEYILNNG